MIGSPSHYCCEHWVENVKLRSVFIDRFIQEDWEAGVPWTGQCWENNPPAHAQR